MKKTMARILSLLLILLLVQSPALAAKKGVATKSFVALSTDEVCAKYDFTHDGKADKLKLNFDNDAQLWPIEVNGERGWINSDSLRSGWPLLAPAVG